MNALEHDCGLTEFLPGVRQGVNQARMNGPIAGFPVVGCKVALIDASYHEIDSSIVAFRMATEACLHDALTKAGPKRIEPIMKVEVVTPEEFMDDVIGDLSSRRGQIVGADLRGNVRLINAMAPFAQLLGYANAVHSMTRGRRDVSISMRFDHYEPVPRPSPDDPNFPGVAASAFSTPPR